MLHVHLPERHTRTCLGHICRLFEKELEYIVNHAQDQYIMLDVTFVDLVVKMQSRFPTVKGYIILTDRQHMPKHSKLQNMLCYDDLLQVCSKSVLSLPLQMCQKTCSLWAICIFACIVCPMLKCNVNAHSKLYMLLHDALAARGDLLPALFLQVSMHGHHG